MSNEQVGTVLTWEGAKGLEEGSRLIFQDPLVPHRTIDEVVMTAKLCTAEDGAEWVYAYLAHLGTRLVILERNKAMMVVVCTEATRSGSGPNLLDTDQPFTFVEFEGWELRYDVQEQCESAVFTHFLQHEVLVGENTLDWVHYGWQSPEPGGTDYRLYQYRSIGGGSRTLLGRIMPEDSKVRVIKKKTEETII